jgi:hypothetical protein
MMLLVLTKTHNEQDMMMLPIDNSIQPKNGMTFLPGTLPMMYDVSSRNLSSLLCESAQVHDISTSFSTIYIYIVQYFQGFAIFHDCQGGEGVPLVDTL